MNCGYEGKIMLLFYGELAGRAREEAQAHLCVCEECASRFVALEKTSVCLNSEQIPVPAALERMALERAIGAMTPRFFEAFVPGWRQAAAACAVAAGLLAGFVSFGAHQRPAGWQSGLEDGLDGAQGRIYRLQEETASLWQADFEYEYAALEDERERLDKETIKGDIYES